MSNWSEEYSAALTVRDKLEKANISTYDAYTRLADRTSLLEDRATHPAASSTILSSSPHPAGSPGKKPAGKQEVSPAQSQSSSSVLAAARKDLIAAQKSRTELSDRLAEATERFEKLKKRSTADRQKLADTSVERTQLQVRLRDRDEELRGKAKLLDDLQAELVSLNLQFNMAEDRSTRLAKENKELVDRWMVRVGKEAEAMNKASKFS